jgi:NAD+ kinase
MTLTFNHGLVVIKQTALAQGGRAAQMAARGDATAHRLIRADAEHQRTVETVRTVLTKAGLAFSEFPLRTLNAKGKGRLAHADFVITVGGDGTALGASHYVRAGLMLGVNSAPGDSVGHFCSVHRRNFAARLKDILTAQWRPTALARLQITLDDKPLDELALNDVLIAHPCPAATTRYLLNVGEVAEEQRSSGLWVATAAGSTAGIGSAGGRKMRRRSRALQFLVRELYREPGRTYQLTRGFAPPGSVLTVASKMPDGRLYIDGARTEYRFPFGARAQITMAAQSLKLFL